MSSSKKPDIKIEENKEWWDWWIQFQAENYQKHLDTLVRHCAEQQKALIYFVRYEDLVDNPKQQMTEIMKFMLDTNDLAGTNAEKRINAVCNAKPS